MHKLQFFTFINNKKAVLEVLYYWSNEANYWQKRGSRGLFATAELLVIYTSPCTWSRSVRWCLAGGWLAEISADLRELETCWCRCDIQMATFTLLYDMFYMMHVHDLLTTSKFLVLFLGKTGFSEYGDFCLRTILAAAGSPISNWFDSFVTVTLCSSAAIWCCRYVQSIIDSDIESDSCVHSTSCDCGDGLTIWLTDNRASIKK